MISTASAEADNIATFLSSERADEKRTEGFDALSFYSRRDKKYRVWQQGEIRYKRAKALFINNLVCKSHPSKNIVIMSRKTNTQTGLAIKNMEIPPLPIGPNKFACPIYCGFSIGIVENGILLPKRFSISLHQATALLYTLYTLVPRIKKEETLDEFIEPAKSVGADWATKITAGKFNEEAPYMVHFRLYRHFKTEKRWQATTRGCMLSPEELETFVEILEDIYMVRFRVAPLFCPLQKKKQLFSLSRSQAAARFSETDDKEAVLQKQNCFFSLSRRPQPDFRPRMIKKPSKPALKRLVTRTP